VSCSGTRRSLAFIPGICIKPSTYQGEQSIELQGDELAKVRFTQCWQRLDYIANPEAVSHALRFTGTHHVRTLCPLAIRSVDEADEVLRHGEYYDIQLCLSVNQHTRSIWNRISISTTDLVSNNNNSQPRDTGLVDTTTSMGSVSP
jgi:hypothetical protein